MKTITIVLSALLLLIKQVESAVVTFAVTNYLGNADTNTIKIYPCAAYVNSDGSIQATGLPTLLPVTNGVSAIYLAPGNYLATNGAIISTYTGPGNVGNSQGILFAVPASGGTYSVGVLAIPGYNVFNYNGATLTNGATFAGVSNALGFVPLSPQQTTNAILANSVSSNNIVLGEQVYGANSSPITSFIGVDSNNLAAANSTVTAYVLGSWSFITNGLATTNYANSVTNGNTSIVYSNPASFTTPTQATNIAQTLTLAQGGSNTNFSLVVSNSVYTNLLAGLQATNTALSASIAASNAVQAVNMLSASNSLSTVKQPASGILTNLALTGAYTNGIAAGTNVWLTTNLITGAVSISATNQTFLTNGLVQWTGLIPSQYMLTNVLPALTNGFISSASIAGLLSSATAAATY